MNKKLTDEQIVKAIENCNNKFDDSCNTCPYKEIEPCGNAQMTDCLDLIHRQKAEIERLTRELDDTICMNEMYIKKVKQNSKLQKKVDKLKFIVKNMEQGYYPLTQLRESMEEEKSVAVEEFAQKIKNGVADYLYKTNFDGRKDNTVDMFELCEIVDKVVKEYEDDN